jgi:SAM-dependent methyltransferase
MRDNNFDSYAHIYDAFYVDKNYENECSNLIQLAKTFTETLDTGLEIGAGSGTFTRYLIKWLKQLEAFELSQSMAQLCTLNLAEFENINVYQGDLLETLGSAIHENSLDLVVANFHVFTYFTNSEVDLFVKICKLFLRKGGVACFDFWDFEAVVANPPLPVVKEAIHQGKKITRKTFPSTNQDCTEVEVNFDFYHESTLLFSECHRMFPRTLEEIKIKFENHLHKKELHLLYHYKPKKLVEVRLNPLS